ncbi:hypothetical protein ABH942_002157 [Flavobacterium sp. 28YEA47A]|uniref:hypothetical protein n=1 Tax=Flavobacterium sp. 28YEA47A TaxID=3156276 RepID=UPI003519841D
MNKIKYHSQSIILHSTLVVTVWILLIVLFLNTDKIGGHLFVILFSLLFLFTTLTLFPTFINYFKKEDAIIFEDNYFIYKTFNLAIKFDDIEKYYFYHPPGGTFLILKFKNFDSYSEVLSKTISGKIALLNFRTFGKSLIFINLRFIRTTEKEIEKKFRYNVNKK